MFFTLENKKCLQFTYYKNKKKNFNTQKQKNSSVGVVGVLEDIVDFAKDVVTRQAF
jgi:hypothetical protein